MDIVVTGFEPFGPEPINTSQEVVKALQETELGFHGEVLATEYGFAETRICQLIDEHTPRLVLMLGLSEASVCLELERIALNIDDARLPDNAGDLRLGSTIKPSSPLALQTDLDLAGVAAQMETQGHEVLISNHAGAYICNHIFYSALHHVAKKNLSTHCLFVHLPPIRQGIQSQEIEYLLKAIQDLIGVLDNG